MTEILTESFCERCGTRYTFESARPKTRLKGVKVLSRGLKNFVLSDDTSMDEAMAAARSETDRELTSHQLDAFHKTFNFCMSCRQYTCPNCWNEVENRCLSCAPHLGHEVLPAAFPDLPSGPLVASEELYTNGAGYSTNGANNASHAPELVGMAEIQARRDEEVDAAARLAALTAPVADVPEAPVATPEPPIAASPVVEAPGPVAPVSPIAQAPIPAAAPAPDGEGANPYDDVDAKTPNWLAKLVAANQVEEAVESRTPPPAPIVPPAPAPKPVAPVKPLVAAEVTPKPVVAAVPEPVVAAVPEPVVAAVPEPVVAAVPEPVVAAVPEPVVAAVPEPVVETVPEPVVAKPAAPAPPAPAEPVGAIAQPTEPRPEPLVEPAGAVAAAGLAAAAIHDAPDETEAAPEDIEALEDKGAAQTSGLLERFRPAPSIAAAAAITPAPAPDVAPAPPQPVAATPPPAARRPAPPVAEPPAPAAQPPTWVPQAPASTELAAAATAAPTPPVHDDVVPQPVWQMVAPDDAPPAPAEVPTQPPAPGTRPEPQWPTQPEWPSATASSTGLPFLGRPAQPTGGLDALWAESTREVARPNAGGRAAGGVQPCVSCGLSLSANARFCRRCGTPQGA